MRIAPIDQHSLNEIVTDRMRWRLLLLLCASVLIGLLVGRLAYVYKKDQYLSAMTLEAETLLTLTSSYVSTYSDILTSHFDNQAPVPAAYRAIAASTFNNNLAGDEHFSALMVGAPGRQIVTPPIDDTMAENLARMSKSGSYHQYSRVTSIGGSPVLRTVFPSVADKPNCVTCHNEIQSGIEKWQLGDLMGAYVIDRGINTALSDIRNLASVLGFMSTALLLLALLLRQQNNTLKIQSNRLLRLASTDSLTGCLNRRALFQKISAYFKTNRVSGGLCVLDIDYFKRINDKYGHDVGDQVLVRFADIVRKNIRESDIFARTGGEEFLLFLPNSSGSETTDTALRICQSIASTAIEFDDDATINVTVSIGAIQMIKSDAKGFEHCMKTADRALYRAKQSGRNQVCIDSS